MPRPATSFFLVLLTVIALAAAAQQPADDLPTPEAAQAAYNEAAAGYKQVFEEMETLRGEYQNADSAARQEINARLPQLLDSARDKMDQWVAAGLTLYKVSPNENQQLADWLAGIAKFYVVGEAPPQATGGNYFGGDQYELAMPVIEALIDGGHPDKNLPVWGGVAAVCVNQFDLAKKYLTAAQQAGLFDSLPQYPSPDMSPDDSFSIKARDYLQNLAEMQANWEAEKQIRDAEAAADDLPRVKFTTTKGDVVIELFENEAPIATANMISLVKSGFYSDVVFHRVLPHFMAQGGDPTGTGSGGPGYSIACECYEPDARKHFRGTLSMAHAGRDTGGSQFFMCFVPTDFLNGRHTAFGRVVEGIEVLGKLQRIDPQAEGPRPTPDKIVSAEVVRDRGHGYEFEKLPGR